VIYGWHSSEEKWGLPERMHARRGGKSRSKTVRSLCGGLSGIIPVFICLYILARGHREHRLTHGMRDNVVRFSVYRLHA